MNQCKPGDRAVVVRTPLGADPQASRNIGKQVMILREIAPIYGCAQWAVEALEPIFDVISQIYRPAGTVAACAKVAVIPLRDPDADLSVAEVREILRQELVRP